MRFLIKEQPLTDGKSDVRNRRRVIVPLLDWELMTDDDITRTDSSSGIQPLSKTPANFQLWFLSFLFPIAFFFLFTFMFTLYFFLILFVRNVATRTCFLFRVERLELNFPHVFRLQAASCFSVSALISPPPNQSHQPQHRIYESQLQDVDTGACTAPHSPSLTYIQMLFNLYLPIWFLSFHLVLSPMCLCCRETDLCKPDTWHRNTLLFKRGFLN